MKILIRSSTSGSSEADTSNSFRFTTSPVRKSRFRFKFREMSATNRSPSFSCPVFSIFIRIQTEVSLETLAATSLSNTLSSDKLGIKPRALTIMYLIEALKLIKSAELSIIKPLSGVNRRTKQILATWII